MRARRGWILLLMVASLGLVTASSQAARKAGDSERAEIVKAIEHSPHNGASPGEYLVTHVRISTVDPSWAGTKLIYDPETGRRPSYSLLLKTRGKWRVVDITNQLACLGVTKAEIGRDLFRNYGGVCK